MKHDELVKTFDELVAKARETFLAKNADYSSDGDALDNFKSIARDLNLPVEKIWYTYAAKGWAAIRSFVSDGKVQSEGIESRIIDGIVYNILLAGIIKDEEEISHEN